MNEVEHFWARLLRRDADQVRATWDTLDQEEQQAVRAHLQRMATEEGWTEPQRISAQAALDALRDQFGADQDAPPAGDA